MVLRAVSDGLAMHFPRKEMASFLELGQQAEQQVVDKGNFGITQMWTTKPALWQMSSYRSEEEAIPELFHHISNYWEEAKKDHERLGS